jgi:F420-non-reducing hydrogenase iron-sulfur subunit
MRRTLKGLGIEPERVKLVWASAAEGVKLAQEIAILIEEIRALGPLQWPQWPLTNGHPNGHMEALKAPQKVVAS